MAISSVRCWVLLLLVALGGPVFGQAAPGERRALSVKEQEILDKQNFDAVYAAAMAQNKEFHQAETTLNEAWQHYLDLFEEAARPLIVAEQDKWLDDRKNKENWGPDPDDRDSLLLLRDRFQEYGDADWYRWMINSAKARAAHLETIIDLSQTPDARLFFMIHPETSLGWEDKDLYLRCRGMIEAKGKETPCAADNFKAEVLTGRYDSDAISLSLADLREEYQEYYLEGNVRLPSSDGNVWFMMQHAEGSRFGGSIVARLGLLRGGKIGFVDLPRPASGEFFLSGTMPERFADEKCQAEIVAAIRMETPFDMSLAFDSPFLNFGPVCVGQCELSYEWADNAYRFVRKSCREKPDEWGYADGLGKLTAPDTVEEKR